MLKQTPIKAYFPAISRMPKNLLLQKKRRKMQNASVQLGDVVDLTVESTSSDDDGQRKNCSPIKNKLSLKKTRDNSSQKAVKPHKKGKLLQYKSETDQSIDKEMCKNPVTDDQENNISLFVNELCTDDLSDRIEREELPVVTCDGAEIEDRLGLRVPEVDQENSVDLPLEKSPKRSRIDHVEVNNSSVLQNPKKQSYLSVKNMKELLPYGTNKPIVDINSTSCKLELNKSMDVLDKTGNNLKAADEEVDSDSYVFVMTHVLESTLAHTEHKQLLTNEHRDFFSSLRNVSFIERKLCVRLLYRKNCWYRFDKLLQDKHLNLNISIQQGEQIFENLKAKQLIVTDCSVEGIETLLKYLFVKEIEEIYKSSFKVQKQDKLTKTFMIDRIVKNAKQQSTLSAQSPVALLKKRVIAQIGKCVKLNPTFRNALLRVQYLFSISQNLDLPTELHRLLAFTVSDPERYAFKSYDSPKLFDNLTEFELYETYYVKYRKLLKLKELKVADKSVIVDIVLQTYEMFADFITKPEYNHYHEKSSLFTVLKRFTIGECLVNILHAGIDVLKSIAKSAKDKTVLNFEQASNLQVRFQKCFQTNCFTYKEVVLVLTTLLEQPFYGQSKKPGWYLQKALILRQWLKEPEQAAGVLVEALKLPNLSDVDVLVLSTQATSLLKAGCNSPVYVDLKSRIIVFSDNIPTVTITATAIRDNAPGNKRIYVAKSDLDTEYVSVETIAIKHYVSHGFTHAVHCEGTAVEALFGLLFWEIIYETYVPNTVITVLQTAPLDMKSREFYHKRQGVIDTRLREISSWTKERVLSEIEIKAHLAERKNCFLQDDLLMLVVILQNIIRCVELTVIVKICERLAMQYGLARAGFPDLIMWSHTRCKFVEVKGQNDTLSPKQILWLRYLKNIGAEVEVCHVHTTGSRGKMQP